MGLASEARPIYLIVWLGVTQARRQPAGTVIKLTPKKIKYVFHR
jgi:hypothetical protein